MKLVSKLLCTTGVIFLLGGTSVFASEMSAKDVMNKAYQYLGSLDKYAFDAVISDEYVRDGEIEKSKHMVSVKLQRPDKLRVDVKGDYKNRSNYLNNGHYVMLDHTFGYYGELDTPKSIDDALDFLINRYGINAPLTSLLYRDMPKRAKFRTSKNFGLMTVAGEECHYIAFKNKNREVHVWVSAGEKPLVKNYSVINTDKTETVRINTTIRWKDASSVKANDFVFTPPKGVMKISVESAN